MNREQIICDTASKALMEEINDLVSTSIIDGWETQYDVCEAFRWISYDADSGGEHKSLLTACRKVHIALGDYVPMSNEEIERTVISSGKPWSFKLNGIAYKWA